MILPVILHLLLLLRLLLLNVRCKALLIPRTGKLQGRGRRHYRRTEQRGKQLEQLEQLE